MKTTQYIENQSPVLHFFDQIYIINLETRIDRLQEITEQFEQIGISLPHPNVHVFKAIRPSSREDWPTLGTKGCYLSHLGVLQDAKKISMGEF